MTAAYLDRINTNHVGHAMQRLFDSKGIFKAGYEDIKPLLESHVSREDAEPIIEFYYKNIELLKGYRI